MGIREDRWERLLECAKEEGLHALFESVRSTFRQNWRNPNESDHSRGLDLKLASGTDTAPAYARIGPHWTAGTIEICFYEVAVGLCREHLAPLLSEIPYHTWPRNRKDNPLDDPVAQIQFLVDTGHWALHKDKLTGLARAIYDAYQARHS